MKKLVLGFLLTAVTLCAEIATLNLGSRGQITLYFPEGWETSVVEMGGQATLNVAPTGDANASCTLVVTFPETDRFSTKARLKTQVEADALPVFQSGAAKGKAVAKEFLLTTGFGFYCSFTDPELQGKPPEKGNYKVMSAGKIRLAPNVLMDVQIMADGFTEPPYQELLGAIEGMEFKSQ